MGGAPEDVPLLEGVFETPKKALSYLLTKGVFAKRGIERFDSWRKSFSSD
jgi:hypothetical protein